jgi:hypothetical protein
MKKIDGAGGAGGGEYDASRVFRSTHLRGFAACLNTTWSDLRDAAWETTPEYLRRRAMTQEHREKEDYIAHSDLSPTL